MSRVRIKCSRIDCGWEFEMESERDVQELQRLTMAQYAQHRCKKPVPQIPDMDGALAYLRGGEVNREL